MGRSAILKVDIIADAKGVGPGVSEADRKFGKMGRAAGLAGKAVAVGVAAAGAAVVGLGVAAAKAASDVEQSAGAVESIYGKAASQVKAYAEAAATNLGLARSEYMQLSAVIGAQLTNLGRSQAEAAGESQGLIKMGADLAATFGGSVSDAVSAVSSLLKGERDPIERYGVSIKQSDVNARLAAEGLDKLKGKALAQAQATTTLALLTEQTSKAHGAFGRESNTLAGQQERLRAQFENVKATIGAGLTPALTTLFSWVSAKVLPGAKELAAQLSTSLGPTITRVGGFITGTLVPAAREIHAWFVDRIAPGIRAAVTPVLNGLRSAFASVSNTVDDNREGLTKIGHVLRVFAEFVATKVAPVVGTVLGAAFRTLGAIIGAQITVVSGIANAIDRVISKIRELAAAVRNSPIGRLAGAIFAAPVVPMTPSLTGGVGSMAGPAMGLARASFSAAAAGSSGVSWRAAASDLQIVDSRTIDARVYIDGDVIDAPGFLTRLERAQTDQAVRLGALTAYRKG